MTVLQKEQKDEAMMQRALETALTQLESVKTEDPTLHHNAMMYLSLIVVCRRDKDEQPQLLRMINTHAENREVERTIMTNIEVLIQEGKVEGLEQGRIYEKRTAVLKLVRHRFADISDSILNEISSIDELVHLDDLFDQILTAESFEDIDFSKNGK